MTRDSRLRSYIRAVLLLAGFILANSLIPPRFEAGPTFFIYLGVVALSSTIKIKLPGLTSSLSPNIIPILVGISELTTTESVLLGLVGALIQCLWHSRGGARWLQLMFHGAVGVVAAAAGGTLLKAIHNWRGAGSSVAFATLAVAYFVMYNLPICTANALSERKRLSEIWRECYAASFPVFMFSAVAAGIYRTAGDPKWVYCAAMAPLLYLVYRAYWISVERLRQEKDGVVESADLNLRTMEALVAAVEARDGANSSDVGRVRACAIATGKELELPEEDMKALAAAALLRDIGKMAVPDYLFARPGKLTPAEMERIRSHVSASAGILRRVNFPFPVIPIIKAHHERWDGTGYPDGLKGENIPLGARILGAVDALVSLSSQRPYRPAISVEEAMERIASEANRAFDPRVVAALQERYKDVEADAEEKAREADSLPLESDSDAFDDSLDYITKARFEDQIAAPSDATLTLRESIAVFALRLSRVVPHDTIAVYVRVGEKLVSEYVNGEDSKLFSTGEIPLGEGISGQVAATGKSSLNADPNNDLVALGHKATRSNLRSMVAVPIESPSGARGVLSLCRSARNGFRVEDLRVLLAVRLKVLNCELLSSASARLEPNANGDAAQDESDATRLSKALA